MAGMILTAGSLLATPATGAAKPQTGTACTGIVQITGLAFTPSSVNPGGTATAGLNARNCTGQRQVATATWLGRFIGSSVGIPAGCPVLDPLPQPVTFAPYGRVRTSVGYQVPASCTAVDLQISVRIQQGGTVLAQQTADLAIVPAAR
jgi:hypothetical protein